jgi:hypothetical protein
MEFKPTISVFERAKRVHVLDRAATVFGHIRKSTFIKSADEVLHIGSDAGVSTRQELNVSPMTIWMVRVQGPMPADFLDRENLMSVFCSSRSCSFLCFISALYS